MTHSGMLYRLDISTFYFYEPLLFQISLLLEDSNSKDGGPSHVMNWGKIDKTCRKIVTRALDEQQKDTFSIISGNLEISKQQIAELKKEINELRQSIDHTENVLEDKVARMEENLGHIESRVRDM